MEQIVHILRPKQEYFDAKQARCDLETFIKQPGPDEIPPCPGCSSHITTLCSANCPEAPRALSIEPERYPIESKVVPLVYELMSTRMMMTCWSCEGHTGVDKKLWKLPMISFYSMSPIYPKILLKHLENLKNKKSITYQWHIVLSDFSQTSGITYSIKPDLSMENDIHLGKLQQDIGFIADDMSSKLKLIAKNMLDKLEEDSS